MMLMNRGFTTVELLVSLAIFIVMTSLVVTKYGNFNQSTLLTDTAYDVALTLRLAQSYGLSVKNASAAGSAANFSYPYGLDFNTGTAASCGSVSSAPTTLVLFADSNPAVTPDGLCGANDAAISTAVLTRGARLSAMCAGSDVDNCHLQSNQASRMFVSFIRPNPEAVICGIRSNGQSMGCTNAYAEITIAGSDGSTRVITVRQNGQISVQR